MLKVIVVLWWKSATKMDTVARRHPMEKGLTTLGRIEGAAKLTYIRSLLSLGTVQRWLGKPAEFVFGLRDRRRLQNGWNFGKVPNCLWPPPPLIFGKSYCGFRDKIATKVRMFIMAGLLCIIWSYLPWDACSTTVQHGNWLKTYPKKTLLYHFHAEKALFKGPKSAI